MSKKPDESAKHATPAAWVNSQAVLKLKDEIDDFQAAGLPPLPARIGKNRHSSPCVEFTGSFRVACTTDAEADALMAAINAALQPLLHPHHLRLLNDLTNLAGSARDSLKKGSSHG